MADWTKIRAQLRKRYDALSPEDREHADADQAAFQERLRIAALPDADARLILVRITLSKWSVIQWWLLESIKDWRRVVTDRALGGTCSASIRAAIRGAKVRIMRAIPTERLVRAAGNGYTTLGEAIDRRRSIDTKMRGEARLVAYEHIGT